MEAGAERGALARSPGGKDACPDGRGKDRTNHPTRGEVPGSWRTGKKWRTGPSPEKKMLFNDERSRNVHENKQKDENLSLEKGETYTKMERHFTQKHAFFAEIDGFFHF